MILSILDGVNVIKESVALMNKGEISITVPQQYNPESDGYTSISLYSNKYKWMVKFKDILLNIAIYHFLLCSLFVLLVVAFTTVMIIKRGGYKMQQL